MEKVNLITRFSVLQKLVSYKKNRLLSLIYSFRKGKVLVGHCQEWKNYNRKELRFGHIQHAATLFQLIFSILCLGFLNIFAKFYFQFHDKMSFPAWVSLKPYPFIGKLFVHFHPRLKTMEIPYNQNQIFWIASCIENYISTDIYFLKYEKLNALQKKSVSFWTYNIFIALLSYNLHGFQFGLTNCFAVHIVTDLVGVLSSCWRMN